MMQTLMSLFMIALMYRQTKANAVELAACFDSVSHDRLTRLRRRPRD